jgi:hypothetical protein
MGQKGQRPSHQERLDRCHLIFASIEDDKILDCFQIMRSCKKQLLRVASGKLFSLFIHTIF